MLQRTAYARETLAALDGVEALHDQPVVREFAVRARRARRAASSSAARTQGVNPGYALGRDYPEYATGCSSRSPSSARAADIDRLAEVLGARGRRRARARGSRGAGMTLDLDGGATPRARARVTIFEKGAPGPARVRRARARRARGGPTRCPARLRRAEPPRLPEVSEPEIVRHYVHLSKRNFDLDSGFYPLGSCTMKHNPRLHERVAALPGHARLHPLQAPARPGRARADVAPAAALGEIAGLPHVSLQPSAGSHGELAGVLLTRAYHEDRGEQRHKVLTPDTAHGTNPATVTMAGYEVVKVGTDADGGIDLDDLRAKATSDVACLMLTNPNTLGLFDPNIAEIAAIVHGVGATLYYDGANLNAIMGICRPGDMGFDIVHFNLHKTFTQPHGGGGPGAGPIAVSDRIEPYLPRPQVVRRARERRATGVRPRLRPAEVDRPAARVPGQLRRASCAPTPTSARSAPRG